MKAPSLSALAGVAVAASLSAFGGGCAGPQRMGGLIDTVDSTPQQAAAAEQGVPARGIDPNAQFTTTPSRQGLWPTRQGITHIPFYTRYFNTMTGKVTEEPEFNADGTPMLYPVPGYASGFGQPKKIYQCKTIDPTVSYQFPTDRAGNLYQRRVTGTIGRLRPCPGFDRPIGFEY